MHPAFRWLLLPFFVAFAWLAGLVAGVFAAGASHLWYEPVAGFSSAVPRLVRLRGLRIPRVLRPRISADARALPRHGSRWVPGMGPLLRSSPALASPSELDDGAVRVGVIVGGARFVPRVLHFAFIFAALCGACVPTPDPRASTAAPTSNAHDAVPTTPVRILDHAGRPAAGVTVDLVHLRAVGVIETAITDHAGVARFRYAADAWFEARVEDPAQLLRPESIDIDLMYSPNRPQEHRLGRVKLGGLRLSEQKAFYHAHGSGYAPGQVTTSWEWTRELANEFPDALWMAFVGQDEGDEVGDAVNVALFVEGHAKREVDVALGFAEEVHAPTLVDLSAVPKAPWASFRLVFFDPSGAPIPDELARRMLAHVFLVKNDEVGVYFEPRELIRGDPTRVAVPEGTYEISVHDGVYPARPHWNGRIDAATTRVELRLTAALRPVEVQVRGLAAIDGTIHARAEGAGIERTCQVVHPSSFDRRLYREPRADGNEETPGVEATMLVAVGKHAFWCKSESYRGEQHAEPRIIEVFADRETPPVVIELGEPIARW